MGQKTQFSIRRTACDVGLIALPGRHEGRPLQDPFSVLSFVWVFCRMIFLAFSSGLCYNTPRCRVRISAIIVASQASEAGSTPVPCSRKTRFCPLDKSVFFHAIRSLQIEQPFALCYNEFEKLEFDEEA